MTPTIHFDRARTAIERGMQRKGMVATAVLRDGLPALQRAAYNHPAIWQPGLKFIFRLINDRISPKDALQDAVSNIAKLFAERPELYSPALNYLATIIYNKAKK